MHWNVVEQAQAAQRVIKDNVIWGLLLLFLAYIFNFCHEKKTFYTQNGLVISTHLLFFLIRIHTIPKII